jgi:diaminopropionate ammonia-lyase
MIDINGKITHFLNPKCAAKTDTYPKHLKNILDIEHVEQTVQDIQSWPDYEITPLHSLTEIAKTIGVKKIWYKDESTRFKLGSFKALGGAYAVAKQIINELKQKHQIDADIQALLSSKYESEVRKISVSCATDGNHGRSVAWGARLFGCECVIYIHRHVSKGRENAIKALGAHVIRIEGNYDDSVRKAAEDAKNFNRLIVSDTSYPGYMDIPKDVAMGYTVMLDEIVRQLDDEIPTHVIIQGGVGGLASAACAYFWQKWQSMRPMFIVVEPVQANCLQLSAKNNRPCVVTGELETLMAGLACGEVSLLAWEILAVGTDYFTTINEEVVAPTMRLLADFDIEAGESAVPGLATLITSAAQNKLAIDENSKVLLIGTEGATDPLLYEKLTGIKIS